MPSSQSAARVKSLLDGADPTLGLQPFPRRGAVEAGFQLWTPRSRADCESRDRALRLCGGRGLEGACRVVAPPRPPLRDGGNAAHPEPAPAKTPPRGEGTARTTARLAPPRPVDDGGFDDAALLRATEAAERAAAAAPTRPAEARVPAAEILALVSGRDAVDAAALEALVARARQAAAPQWD